MREWCGAAGFIAPPVAAAASRSPVWLSRRGASVIRHEILRRGTNENTHASDRLPLEWRFFGPKRGGRDPLTGGADVARWNPGLSADALPRVLQPRRVEWTKTHGRRRAVYSRRWVWAWVRRAFGVFVGLGARLALTE